MSYPLQKLPYVTKASHRLAGKVRDLFAGTLAVKRLWISATAVVGLNLHRTLMNFKKELRSGSSSCDSHCCEKADDKSRTLNREDPGVRYSGASVQSLRVICELRTVHFHGV